ncbi:MAG: response regulator [Pseudomonadales bacterium]|nr:response regulator [Pseudomonadales bacterium]
MVVSSRVFNHQSSQRFLRYLVGLGLGLLLLLISPLTIANSIEITADRFHINATSKIEYLEDSSQQLKAIDLTHPNVIKQFAHSHSDILRFGFTDNVIWTRIDIDNQQDATTTAILHIDRPNIDQIDLFHIKGDQVIPVSKHTPANHAFMLQSGRSPAFNIQLEAREQKQLFARFSSSHFLNAAIQLSDPISYSIHIGNINTLIGIGLGILAGLFIYSLFVALRYRVKVYYFYLGYIGCALTYMLAQSGYLGIQWLSLPQLHPKLEAGTFLLTITAACILERHFLNTSKRTPYIDYALLAAALICFLTALVIPFVSNNLGMQASYIIAISATPIMLLALFVHWINGFKPARFYLASRVIFLAIAGIAAQTLFGELPANMTLSWLLLIGITLDVVLVHFAIVDRQKEINAKQESQQQRIAIADAVTRTKSEFLAQLSHEIRTPMNGILGMTELLGGTPLSHTQQDYLKTISSSGSHLLKILDDVLDFSKIEAGKMSIDISAFDISSMLTECIELFKSRIEEKQLELVTHIDSDVAPQLKGDPIRIRQVLTNLISNAVKYTDHGEVIINIRKDPDRGPQHVLFEVSDTGIGIAPETLKLLFKTNQPIDPTESKGLGLAISERLVKMMEGEINAESQQGKGSLFWFSLPLEPVEEEQRAPILTEKLQGLRLLVVDDNASCRLVIQQQANSWGMNVHTAVNGKQALAMLRTQANLEEPFDIVILDHEMPGMNGLELAARIKEDPLVNNHLLVIMLTGLGVAPSTTAARNAGIRRVITKPVTGRMLKITLAEELGHLQKIEQAHPDPEEPDAPLSSKLSILVAEDHYLSQKVIKGMLARLGLECDTVSNGKDAIEAACKKDYSLILMDCEMPDVNGFEATRQIRRWEKANNREEAPIIALTAHIMDEHKERSLECGMNAHLSKPIELSELRDTIIRWTKNKPDNVQSINNGLRA